MWFRILVLALGTFAIGTDSFVIAGILPDIAGSLHISLTLAGLTITVFALVYAMGAPILAALTGTFERRRLLLISLLILTAANLLAALASNLPLLMAARVLAAVGAALYTPTASATATTLAPVEKRGRALALVMTGLTASTVLGVPLGVLIGSWMNWQTTLIFVALLSGLAFLGVIALFPRISAPPVVTLRARMAFLKRPGLLIALIHTFLFMAGTQIVSTYARPFLQQITHLDEVMVSVMLLIFGIAGVIGGFVGGSGADRWGSIRTMAWAMVLLTITLFSLPWTATTLPGAIVSFLIWGITGWSLMPAQQHRLVSFAPEAAGVILSLNSSAIYLGISGGSALGSILLQSSSLTIMCIVAAIWEGLTLVVILSTTRQRRHTTKSEEIEVARG